MKTKKLNLKITILSILVSLLFFVSGILLLVKVSSSLTQNANVGGNLTVQEQPFKNGDGSASNPYLVSTAQDLNNVRNYLYQKDDNGDFILSSPNHFVQTNDINLANFDFNGDNAGNFDPIGSDQTPFAGTYEGNGYTISGLYIDSANNNVGLFSNISSSGQIFGLSISSAQVQGASVVGSIAGVNNGLIQYCFNDSTVIGSNAGGIVGLNAGSILDSYNSGDVSGSNNGGIAGSNTGTISRVYNSGIISNGGGIAYQSDGVISYSAFINSSSSAISSGGSDTSSAISVSQEQLNGQATLSSGNYLTAHINSQASTPAFFYSEDSSISAPQIWLNSQDLTLRLTGDGTQTSPFAITSPQALALIGKSFSASQFRTIQFDLNDFYSQTVDITFKGVDTNGSTAGNFDPVGYISGGVQSFAGVYSGQSSDGERAKISDLDINTPSTSIGLFSQIGLGATVENLSIRDSSITTSTTALFNMGAIAAVNNGTIANCDNFSDINKPLVESNFPGGQSSNLGGIAAQNNGTISLCANLGDLTSIYSGTVTTATSFVGGLVASNNGIIERSYNAGNLSGGQTGGLATVNSNQLNHSFNMGNADGNFSVGNGRYWESGIATNNSGSISFTLNLGVSDYGIAIMNTGSFNNVYWLEGLSYQNVMNGSTTENLINVNQIAGMENINGQNFIDLFNSQGQYWVFDRAYLCEDGNNYQFAHLTSNYTKKMHPLAMRITQDGRYHMVENTAQFMGVGNYYNAIAYPGSGNFILLCDVNMSGQTYEAKEYLHGEFNGNGHTVSNVTLNTSGFNQLGIFNEISNGGYLHDLNLNNISITNTSNNDGGATGTVAGSVGTDAIIDNVHVNTTYVNGRRDAGCFIGNLTKEISSGNGYIQNCSVINGQATTRDGDDSGHPTGGFVGWTNGGIIRQCFTYNSSTSEDGPYLANAHLRVGGFVGIIESDSLIENCFAHGSVWVERVVWASGITTQDMDTAGGFVGWNNSSTSTVRNCYAHTTVTRRENWGYSQAATRGFGRGALTSWQNNYYVEGDYTESNGGGTQLSWDQMRQQSSFSGYDFSSIWQMSSSWGVPVPIGANQTLSSKGVAVVSTDAGSTVQLYSGGSLLTTTTATSGGAEFQNLDFGSYSARIFRNGQSLTSGSYETVEFSLSSDNPWQMVSSSRWFAGGDGTEDNPYIINSISQWQNLNNFAQAGEDTYFKLAKNLNFNRQEIVPISDFRGILDGDDHQIYNFVINSSNANVGIFESLTNAEISNLGISSFEITATSAGQVGALAAEASNSTILFVYADGGDISASGVTGGLIGSISGTTISGSYASVSISGQNSGFVGGFVGQVTNSSNISQSYSGGNIVGLNNIGGFIGLVQDSSISNCYTTSAINSSYNSAQDSSIGGFIGQSSGAAISNSFMHGSVKTTLANAGVFIGYNSSSSLKNNYAWNVNNLRLVQRGDQSQSISFLTTEQFLSASNFNGFDFISVWGMSKQSYPVLRNVSNASEISETVMGSGTENDPYLIFDRQTFSEIEEYYNQSVSTRSGEKIYFRLMQDIDLSGDDWQALFSSQAFTGVLDGNGNSITSVSLSATSNGIFQQAQNAIFKNIVLSNPRISSTAENVAILCGNATSTSFENITVQGGTVASHGSTAAVVGTSSDCTFKNITLQNATISGSSAGGVSAVSTNDTFSSITIEQSNISATNYAGGVASSTTNSEIGQTDVKNSSITASNAGGIVGNMQGGEILLSNSLLNNLSGALAGGVVANASQGSLTSVYVEGLTLANATNAGIVAGQISSTSVVGATVMLKNSLSATSSIGGIVGIANASVVDNCTINTVWTEGNLTLQAANVGGIVGSSQDMQSISENRITNMILTSTGGGAIGQIYGSITGAANAANNMYRNITINANSSTNNSLGGTTVSDTYNTGTGVITYEWTLV